MSQHCGAPEYLRLYCRYSDTLFLYSHTAYHLSLIHIYHLIHTANNARVLSASLNMGNLAYLTGFFHDLGKWRLRFKEYLEAAVLHPDSVRRGEVNHSSTGAIYVYRKYYHGDRLHRLTAQLISVAILSHHGLNDCMDLNGTDHFHRRVESLEGLDYDEVMEHFKASETNEEELDEYFEKAVAEVQCFMAVSYTHLDVYKRQGKCFLN